MRWQPCVFFSLYIMLCSTRKRVCVCDERENKRHYSFIGILIASSFIFYILLLDAYTRAHHRTRHIISYLLLCIFYSRGKKKRTRNPRSAVAAVAVE